MYFLVSFDADRADHECQRVYFGPWDVEGWEVGVVGHGQHAVGGGRWAQAAAEDALPAGDDDVHAPPLDKGVIAEWCAGHHIAAGKGGQHVAAADLGHEGGAAKAGHHIARGGGWRLPHGAHVCQRSSRQQRDACGICRRHNAAAGLSG